MSLVKALRALLIFALLIPAFPAHSYPKFKFVPTPAVRHKLGVCQAEVAAHAEEIYLPPLLSMWNLWRRPRVQVGTFAEVQRLLELNQIPAPIPQKIAEKIRTVQEKLAEDIQMADLLIWLQRPENELFVCIGDSDCQIRHPQATGAHVARPARLVPRSWHQFQQLRTLIAQGTVKTSTQAITFEKGPTTLFMNTGRYLADENNWTEMLFHELSHSADLQLIYLWATANQLRVAHGMEPDNTFRAMFAVVGDKFYMHQGLYKQFVESRAYRLSALVGMTLRPDLAETINDRSIAQAQNEIRPLLSPFEWDFLEMDNPQVLVARGLGWGQIMKDTITETYTEMKRRGLLP